MTVYSVICMSSRGRPERAVAASTGSNGGHAVQLELVGGEVLSVDVAASRGDLRLHLYADGSLVSRRYLPRTLAGISALARRGGAVELPVSLKDIMDEEGVQ